MTLWTRIEKVMEQGLDASRGVLDKARGGAKDLGEKGVLKFDLIQLERQSAKLMTRLGAEVYDALSKRNQNTVSRNTAGVKELVAELADLERRIKDKEQALEQSREDPAAADSSD